MFIKFISTVRGAESEGEEMELLQPACLRKVRPFSIIIILVWCMNLSLLQPLESLSSIHNSMVVGNETDRVALSAFKDRIFEDPFGALSSWNDSLHHCNWNGITCSRRHPQRVTVLNLTMLGLTGSISPSIGNLSFLRVINLTLNNLHGTIPQEIGHLFRLSHLLLDTNSLQREIPANLSRCSALETLSLTKNQLTGEIPHDLGSLSNLIRLRLDSNNLTGTIPPTLGNLSSLFELSLITNNLEGSIPEDLGKMKNLVGIILGENKLSGMVPPSLFNISSLIYLNLPINQLQGSLPPDIGASLLPNLQAILLGENKFTGSIPASLANASRLEMISFPNNNFTGPVPASLGRLQNLQILNLNNNQLGTEGDDMSIVTSLTNCTNLRRLILDDNYLRGAIPNSIGKLSTQLSILSLGNNQIFGSVPTAIENLINLNFLSMSDNYLTGKIPDGIGKLQNLEGLYLDQNKFSGWIPPSLGNLTRLTQITLYVNDLEGSIPNSLGHCQRLQIIELARNRLNGTIPKEILAITTLTEIILHRNHLSGPLPLEMGNLKFLVTLSISYNNFNGEIPNTLGNCLSLKGLYMDANFFQGAIPPSFSSLKSIEELDLSRNNLTGHIPKYLTTFSSLSYLNLSFNLFYGEVPQGGIFSNISAFSISGNSELCGGIPQLQLRSCPKQATEEHKRKKHLRRVILIICVLLFSISLLCVGATLLFMRKNKKKATSQSASQQQKLRLSYAQLHKATDGFSLANLIGVGTFGSVYKGMLDQDEKIVAVKVLNLQQRGASKSFVAECEALRNIRHRNLVKIITACSSIDFGGNDFKALVFEYMPNGSLEAWLHANADEQHQSRNLNIIQRLNVAIDVASALEYLHHHYDTSVVHRDLKPSNVLLDDDMNAHLSDFGLAKILREGATYSSQHQVSSVVIKGTIGYIAPEYGMGSEVSTLADVYSYGILLLEMITGKRPTDGMFKDKFSLHQFVKLSLSKRVMEIVDPLLITEENEITNSSKLHEFFVSFSRVGVSCSAESPKDRMDMRDVVKEMHTLRTLVLGL